jgi:hypothetical protein
VKKYQLLSKIFSIGNNIIGSQNGKKITAVEVANRSGSIVNELLSRLGSRLDTIVKY